MTHRSRRWSRGILTVILVLVVTATPMPEAALAGGGRVNGGTGFPLVSVLWGTFDADGRSTRLNYVALSGSMPGLRGYGFVCGLVEVWNDGRRVLQSSHVCRDFGPGFTTASAQWYAYNPTRAGDRLVLHRCFAELRAWFTGGYVGALGDNRLEAGGGPTVVVRIC